MIFARESLSKIKPDITPLLDKEWAESPIADHWDFGIDPDWAQYNLMDKHNMLHAFTARKNRQLTGYAVFILSESPHHKNTLLAKLDLFYMEPEARKGMAAVKLLRFAEMHLVASGAKIVALSCFSGSRVSAIYQKMGYTPTEQVFFKMVS